MVKQKLVALLLVSVMVASAFGAIGLSATKVEAASPLKVTSISPPNKAVSVSTAKTIIVSFSEVIGAGGDLDKIKVTRVSDNKPVSFMSFRISGVDNVLTVDPQLQSNTAYRLFVPKAAVRDATGHTLDADVTATFTTAKTTPPTPPSLRITAIDPAKGALHVPISKTIVVTFNRNIWPGGNFANITLKVGTQQFALTKSISSNKLLLNPTTRLAYGNLPVTAQFIVGIPRNAITSSNTNDAGMLASTFSSQFKTQSLPPLPSPDPSPAQRPMFRADLQHTGVYATSSNPAGILKWHFPMTGGVASSPVVYGDRVYVGGNDHYIYALSAATGKVVWKYLTGARVQSSPAVYNGKVYVGSDDNYLYALNAATGKLVWKYKTSWWVASSPLVYNNIVFTTSYGEWLYALDATTGHLKWRASFAGGQVSPTLYKGVFYYGGISGTFYARYTSNGMQKWSSAVGSRGATMGASTPAVVNGVAYVGSRDQYLYAIDLSIGQVRWKVKTGFWVESSPAVANGAVYFGSMDGYTYAVSATTGNVLWKHLVGGTNDWINSSPAVANNIVYAQSSNGHLEALERSTGSLKWQYNVGQQSGISPLSSPVIYNGVLYVGGGHGVYAIK